MQAIPDRLRSRWLDRTSGSAAAVKAGGVQALLRQGVIVLVAAAAIAAASAAGAWFAPFLAGLAGGLAVRRLRRRAALLTGLAVVLGWIAPLAWETLQGAPVGAVARTVAALAGLPPYAAVTMAAMLLTALAQAAAGTWLGRAVISLRSPIAAGEAGTRPPRQRGSDTAGSPAVRSE
jgi:hypothetical protein